jgi:ABC-2 type transport system ATP-binding protein
MSGYDFVRTCARLSGLSRSEAKSAAETAMTRVGMTEHMNRAIKGYSKGMRQRTKIAQSLVHEPRVLFLDEPLSGTDPVARRDLIDIIRGLANAGASVLVSSHVLHEIQSLTPNIVLLHRGRLVAEGHVREIRDLIDQHPHRIVLVCDQPRNLAARLAAWDDVTGIQFSDAESRILVETRQPDAFYTRLPALVASDGLTPREVYSEDDNLEAVFKYLVNQ